MDIALILSKIRPNAKWRMSGTYEQLENTWEDEEQTLPSLQEITDAWETLTTPTLEELKAIKYAEVLELTSSKITGGFTMPVNALSIKFDSDIETQITMQGIAVNAENEEFIKRYPEGVPIRGVAENKTEKEKFYLNGVGVLAFCVYLSEHIGQCKQRGWELQQAIDTAETVEELEEVNW